MIEIFSPVANDMLVLSILVGIVGISFCGILFFGLVILNRKISSDSPSRNRVYPDGDTKYGYASNEKETERINFK